jgi:hypothetical protein
VIEGHQLARRPSFFRGFSLIPDRLRGVFIKSAGEPKSLIGPSSRTASRNSGKSLELVEYTGGLFRQGKASISEELAGIFERLGLSAQRWQHGTEKLRGDRLVGRFFAASRAKLREIADRIGVRHLVNLTGCLIR